MPRGLKSVPEFALKANFYRPSTYKGETAYQASFEAKIIFNYMQIKDILLGEGYKSLEDLSAYLIRERLGLMWDNPIFAFSNIYGEEFEFLVYQDRISVWDHHGSVSIGVFPRTSTGVREMLAASEEYTHGLIRCSECGDKMLKTDTAGRYFAGSYCKRCWETDWIDENGREHKNVRDIEAHENYE